jgi:hypothetical protein
MPHEECEPAEQLTELARDDVTEPVAVPRDRLDRDCDRQERKEALMAIGRDVASRLSPEVRAMDIDEYLYDELGLPK